MARVKAESLPGYAKSDSACWKTQGLSVATKTENFKASPKGSDDKVELTAKYPQVNFGGSLEVATAFYGGLDKLLIEAQDATNAWLQIQGKNKAKGETLGFEQKVADKTNEAIAAFTEKRGTAPTDEQRNTIKARVRARLEELERLANESVDVEGV